MRKILGTVLFAMSLIGGATVVLAQSSRDLTPVTGTEANRLFLTIRLPFETFYNSLTDELRQRLRRGELESVGIAAGASEGQGQTIIDRRAPACAEPAAGTADRTMQAIAPAAHEQQRAGLEALRQRLVPMAQLIAGSCPSDTHLDDPMARFAAAKDRLDVMLFVVMSMSPMLQGAGGLKK
jgi:hypothetical protein